MPDDHSDAEAKLQKLAQRLHRGWAKLHPATTKELAAVRAVVQEQWEQEHRACHSPKMEMTKDQTQQKQLHAQKKTVQKKKSGQGQKIQKPFKGHGHSH